MTRRRSQFHGNQNAVRKLLADNEIHTGHLQPSAFELQFSADGALGEQ